MKKNAILAIGRRKTSVARVRITPGQGNIEVNNKPLLDYFKRATLKMIIEQPLVVTETLDKYDIHARVTGGGLSGQAGALLLGISRALVKVEDEYKTTLRRNGFLTRDPRMVERKKYGQPGARKRFQFSKR